MENWLQRRLSRISLSDLNFYPIVIILFLTVIFSSLLIYDEYKGFEKTVHLELASHDGSSLMALEKVSSTSKEFKGRLIKIVLEIATLALILFGVIVGISKIINAMIAREVDAFLRFYESAQSKMKLINPDELYFSESIKMAHYANEMAKSLQSQTEALQQMNVNLEERVQLKTQALQLQNVALEKEQKFSEGLLESHKQFIRYAIHETYTPLSVIMANIELFTMKEGRNRYLAKIEAGVKNIFSIYDDLSYLVKKDQIEYPKKAIDLGEYVASRIEFFDEVAHFSNLSFDYQEPESLSWIFFNETKLQRVVDNNLTNAIKYSKSGEVIHVGVLCSMMECSFWVQSKSEKIHDEEKIFEAYYRERQKTDGFGLGLNLVKSICDEEDVIIVIDSNTEFTRFEYTFKKRGMDENLFA
ncbi:MAG TPA: HAMP domain-containing sensor histidine kinase [Sulfuricurvum sp.]|nr:MAG: histidine kinase [Campylobacterales bacterium 16-40-21]OZA02259.1 MAG: histidine kinase [Sulfuricurvum sp. 17-40-25]HQS67669.1 HAMP domain-containing sensor histidine kinase [Sulfuricurvum sp.]HQT37752.1 HAMP domain-containing sensor histidine kinase [Sulfuricurvum sp.]